MLVNLKIFSFLLIQILLCIASFQLNAKEIDRDDLKVLARKAKDRCMEQRDCGECSIKLQEENDDKKFSENPMKKLSFEELVRIYTGNMCSYMRTAHDIEVKNIFFHYTKSFVNDDETVRSFLDKKMVKSKLVTKKDLAKDLSKKRMVFFLNQYGYMVKCSEIASSMGRSRIMREQRKPTYYSWVKFLIEAGDMRIYRVFNDISYIDQKTGKRDSLNLSAIDFDHNCNEETVADFLKNCEFSKEDPNHHSRTGVYPGEYCNTLKKRLTIKGTYNVKYFKDLSLQEKKDFYQKYIDE